MAAPGKAYFINLLVITGYVKCVPEKNTNDYQMISYEN
jgi:hypothetical protein